MLNYIHLTKRLRFRQSYVPDYSWQKLGSDLFELQGKHYLLLRYVDIVKLTPTTSSAEISAIKSVFSGHGIPELLISDNGPQYASKEFEEFAEKYCKAQNAGGGKLRQIGNFKNLAGKTLANCNELSLSSLTKTFHSNAMLNLKPRSFTLASCAALKWCTHLVVDTFRTGPGCLVRMCYNV